jgi:hypothetical protein
MVINTKTAFITLSSTKWQMPPSLLTSSHTAALRPVARLVQDEEPRRAGSEARGRKGSAQGEVAMTTTQRQWVYVIVAGIVGGVLAFLVVWWFG